MNQPEVEVEKNHILTVNQPTVTFFYLQVIRFEDASIAAFIAVVGILSIVAQVSIFLFLCGHNLSIQKTYIWELFFMHFLELRNLKIRFCDFCRLLPEEQATFLRTVKN